MKTVFVLGGVVVAMGIAHQPGATIGTTIAGAVGHELPDESPVDVGYTYDEAEDVFNAPAAVYPVITPPQMRLLYTSPERIAIRANLASATPDPVIADFFSELNDPQLTEVDLNLKSVQGVIEYSLNLVAPHMSPRYTAEDITRRKLEMLTGKPQ